MFTYEDAMRPVLDFLKSGEVWQKREITEAILGERYFNLTEADKAERTASGVALYASRVGWALSYLYQAALITRPKRAHYKITDRGLETLQKNVAVTKQYLEEFEQFQDFLGRDNRNLKIKKNSERLTAIDESKNEAEEFGATPEEVVDQQLGIIHKELSSELLEEILAKDAFFFEDLVVKLLYKMGYGSHVDQAKVTKRSGDDGIDGIISSDRLGLDTIYVQAKRYATDNIVGNNQIRDFMGALLQKGATKGVFITTSDFSDSAKRAVRENRHQVIALINGQQLTSLMIEYNLGVSIEREIHIKRLDSDFFDENF